MPDGSVWVALQLDFSIVHLARDGCYERIAVPRLEPHDRWIIPNLQDLAVGERIFVIAFSKPGSIDAYAGDPGWWSVMQPAPGHFPYRILADGYDAWYLEWTGLEHLSGGASDRTIPIPMMGPYERSIARGAGNSIWVSDGTTIFEVDTVSGHVAAFKPEPGRSVGSLDVGSDGSVWFRSGNDLGHLKNGTLSFEALPMPMPDATSAFDVAPDGVARFASGRQLYRYDRGGIHVTTLESEVDAIAGTSDGGAWLALSYPAAMEYLDKNGKATVFDLYALQQASIGDHPPHRCSR